MRTRIALVTLALTATFIACDGARRVGGVLQDAGRMLADAGSAGAQTTGPRTVALRWETVEATCEAVQETGAGSGDNSVRVDWPGLDPRRVRVASVSYCRGTEVCFVVPDLRIVFAAPAVSADSRVLPDSAETCRFAGPETRFYLTLGIEP